MYPLIALNCAASLVSWAIIATSLKVFCLLLPIAHVSLQTGIAAMYHRFSNDLKCEEFQQRKNEIFKLSIFTSWITPFTVLMNNDFASKTFLNRKYFIVSSASMHMVILLSVASVLISNPYIKFMECSNPLLSNQSSLDQNDVAYNSSSLNSNGSKWMYGLPPYFKTKEPLR